MGKIFNFLLLSVCIQVGLLLFAGTGSDVNISVDNGQETAVTALFTEPQDWFNNLFFTFLSASFTAFGLGAAAVIVGTFFVRNEWIFYAGMGAIFLSFIAPFINLWQVLSAQGSFGAASSIIMAMFLTPLIILGIVVILDFTRGKD